MSLQTLLAQYPNFSARRVRRLATQLQFLDGLNSPEAKGIATDLMALTMQVARTEAQLADLTQDSPEKAGRSAESLYHPCTHILIEGLRELPHGSQVLSRWDSARAKFDKQFEENLVKNVVVVPATRAALALDDLAEFCDRNSDIRLSGEYEERIKLIKSTMYGHAFTAPGPVAEGDKS